MIGGSLYGTGKHFADLTASHRVTAMEVCLFFLLGSQCLATDNLLSTGGSARLDTASRPSSANVRYASFWLA